MANEKVIIMKCTKEKELKQISDTLIRIEEHVEFIRTILDGNGHRGLIAQVDDNSIALNKGRGALMVVGVLIGILTLITLLPIVF